MNRYQALVVAEFSAFLAACTTPDRSARVPASKLYDAYVAWSERSASPIPPMTATMFGRLANESLIKRHGNTGNYFMGVALS